MVFAGAKLKGIDQEALFRSTQDDRGIGFFEDRASVLWGDGNQMLVPRDVQVGDVVCDGRGGEVGDDAGDRFYFGGNQIETTLPFRVEGLMVFTQIAFERFYHTDDFFLAQFLTATQSVLVRTI